MIFLEALEVPPNPSVQAISKLEAALAAEAVVFFWAKGDLVLLRIPGGQRFSKHVVISMVW